MDYVVTARKWRPQRFDEVVGQEHITATLKNSIKNNRIAHAFIFTGPRGVGKTTTARILAKALNCENPKDIEPCNECSMCKSINESQSLDIIEIDGASNRGIDEIRTLRESVKYAPTKGKYKVYIIDEVHMLTKESFNAFLKTLEEPPSHTIFVFATTDIHKVPLTIISRCQRFDFRRIQLDVIKKQLKAIAEEEKIKIDDKTLTIISKKSDGALRDAQSFFDQVIAFCGNKIDSETVIKMLNLIDEEIYFNISDAILNKNFKVVFEVTDQIYKNGWDFIDFMDGLIEHFRNILSVVITSKNEIVETAEDYKKRYSEYTNTFSKGDIIRALNYLAKAQQELKYSNNQKLKIEVTLSNLIALERSSTISDIINEINDVPSLDHQDLNVKKNFSNKTEILKSNSTRVKSNSDDRELTTIHSPAIQTKTNHTLNFDSVINKWSTFLEQISIEKALILYPIFNKCKVVAFNSNEIELGKLVDEDFKTISMNKDYLDKKTREVFGGKLSFKPEIDAKSEKKAKKIKKTDNSSLEQLIIDELGGQEV